MPKTLTKEQQAQASDYKFPYHHLVNVDVVGGSFKSFLNLGFALPYAVTAKLVFGVLEQNSIKRWCDIGCGDGGLFALLADETTHIQKTGIDFDQRSVELATLLNDTACSFQYSDILDGSYKPNEYDLVTLIEVFEHIPPDIAETFLERVGEHVDRGGDLVITVPHKNQRMPAKHFRHFDLAEMTSYCHNTLPGFEIQEVFGFNVKNAVERFVKGVLRTRHLFLEMPWLNRIRFDAQLNAIPVSEKSCQQIFLRLTRRS